MILYLIGIDYKVAPLAIRESIYKARKEILDFWQVKGEERSALFTCNRIELYGISENIFSAANTINLFRAKFPDLFERFYVKQGNTEVIEHALRLACGLESQIAGEEEITVQLNSWVRQKFFPWILRKVWSEVLTRAEDVRVKSGLKEARSNIATVIFNDLNKQREIVIIGTGKIAFLLAENRPSWANLHFVARKKHKVAARLARQSGGRAVLLDELERLLLETDAVISATSSPHYILEKRHLLDVAEKRDRPLYVYDLAVPRDIEPDAGAIPGIFLKDLDDLDLIFKQHNQDLNSYIKKAELLILHHIFEVAGQVKEKNHAYSY